MTKWVTPAFDFGLSSITNEPVSKSQKRNLSYAFGNHMKDSHTESNHFTNQNRVVKRAHIDNVLMWTDKHAPSSQVSIHFYS